MPSARAAGGRAPLWLCRRPPCPCARPCVLRAKLPPLTRNWSSGRCTLLSRQPASTTASSADRSSLHLHRPSTIPCPSGCWARCSHRCLRMEGDAPRAGFSSRFSGWQLAIQRGQGKQFRCRRGSDASGRIRPGLSIIDQPLFVYHLRLALFCCALRRLTHGLCRYS